MSTLASTPMFCGPDPVGCGLSRPRLRVEDLPDLHYEAALLLEGREVTRGNRSRVVYLANVLSDKLKDAQGPLELVVLCAAAPATSRVELSWMSLHAGRLRFHICFGGVTLRRLTLGKCHIEGELGEQLQIEAGESLRLELENPLGTQVQAMAALIVERINAPTWLRERVPVYAPRVRTSAA